MEWILWYYEFGLACMSLMAIAEISEEDFNISDLGSILITLLLAAWIWPVFAITDLVGMVCTRMLNSKKG